MSVHRMGDCVSVLQRIGAIDTFPINTYSPLLDCILVVLPGVRSKFLRIHIQNCLSKPSLYIIRNAESNLLAMRFMFVNIRNHISLSISNLIFRFVA